MTEIIAQQALVDTIGEQVSRSGFFQFHPRWATVYIFQILIIEACANAFFRVSCLGDYICRIAANIVGVILAAPLQPDRKRTYMGSALIVFVLRIFHACNGKTDLALMTTFQVFISICAGSIFPYFGPYAIAI